MAWSDLAQLVSMSGLFSSWFVVSSCSSESITIWTLVLLSYFPEWTGKTETARVYEPQETKRVNVSKSKLYSGPLRDSHKMASVCRSRAGEWSRCSLSVCGPRPSWWTRPRNGPGINLERPKVPANVNKALEQTNGFPRGAHKHGEMYRATKWIKHCWAPLKHKMRTQSNEKQGLSSCRGACLKGFYPRMDLGKIHSGRPTRDNNRETFHSLSLLSQSSQAPF